MEHKAINIEEKLLQFSEHWSPKSIAPLNDYHVKLAKVQGEFVWHDHPETDEFFYILSGSLDILLRDGTVTLNAGEMYIVPKGIEHKPFAAQECRLMLIGPAGTVNTGNVVDALTKHNGTWI